MTTAAKRRFDPARIFHPDSICLSGSLTRLGQKVLSHLRAGGFAGVIGTAEHDPVLNADLALVADDAPDIPAALTGHAARGARGAIVLSFMQGPGLAAMADAAGIRTLGPHSFGMVLPGLGLNASPFPLIPSKGRVALVGQSSSIARTVIDWAVPNRVGFSHLIGVGGNDATLGFGLVLDHLGRDPDTAAIMVEIDRLRDPRAFFSAARMAARLRPVVAIAPGLRLKDPTGATYAAMEAALGRAGVLLTASVGEFLAAAETLTRVKPARNERLAIVTNSVSLGRMAADEVLRSGMSLATLSPETAQVLSLTTSRPPPSTGPIFSGKRSPTALADIAALLSSAPEVGGILVIHAPSGEDDGAAIAALTACAKTVKIPLLIAAMGEATGLEHRHILSQARLACFDSPEAAIGGFRHLLENRRNRAQARELPSSAVLSVLPNKASVIGRIEAARAEEHSQMVQDEALAVISAYHIPALESRHVSTPAEAAAAAATLGFPAVLKLSHPDVPTHLLTGSVVLNLPDPGAVLHAGRAILAQLSQLGADPAKAGFVVQAQAPHGTMLRIRVADDPRLGPVIGFGEGGGDPEDVSRLAAGLPPLNLPLAHALIHRAGVERYLTAHRGQAAADEDAIAATLVRVSQLIIDTPEILALDIDPLFASPQGVAAASARIWLRPEGQTRPPLVIPPYPSELTQHYTARGQNFLLRPIRPEDADAHAAMLSRFTQEDMRYRFFSPMKRLPLEQIVRLADVDYTREMAIIAVHEATGETAGVARLVRNDTDGTSAEFAVAVDPSYKKFGLGTALMQSVIEWGKARAVKEIVGQILADNTPMLTFIKRLGFSLSRMPDEPDIMEAKLELQSGPSS
ncbi:bifunctional acetate--CoA ligase family protein/GNAT family N-acetyltransferase [Acidocella aminolytica]|uniref:N-acetyltransferase GCN5 n=1 Tax=Acidocella aminolytica 101 = DSM 11237 TaxID=1120923 RepID=A0A0D6PBT4_9PROT|nr:GNAT family N-acetyltransferase [Acidocella aminolytica]GAN79112.1 N-acetyltransferase GCN5 [Acidocella aminolytica 101 = DSM 11237]SHE65071.1 acetyltransferase [Acidocella aminolytica 101 = DSM 11237]